MAFTVPVLADFKAYFTRDFQYGVSSTQVNDADITRALAEAGFNFPSCVASQTSYTTLYLYLAANMLVENLAMSGQGTKGQYDWITQAKSVGNVSQTFGIPQYILDKPAFAMLCKNKYGAKYLQLLLPFLVGQVFTSARWTDPA